MLLKAEFFLGSKTNWSQIQSLEPAGGFFGMDRYPHLPSSGRCPAWALLGSCTGSHSSITTREALLCTLELLSTPSRDGEGYGDFKAAPRCKTGWVGGGKRSAGVCMGRWEDHSGGRKVEVLVAW